MRASTLATFELVTTRPTTRSPGVTVVSLTFTSRICGAASGGNRSTLFGGDGIAATCFGAAADPAVAVAEGVAVTVFVGFGAGFCVAGAGAAGRDAEGDGDCAEVVVRAGWVQPANANESAAMTRSRPGTRIGAWFCPPEVEDSLLDGA